jgi:hypothetical protein
MTFVAGLWAGKEAISLVADLATLLELGKGEKDPTLRDTLLSLRSKAADSADQLSAQIQELAEELGGLGLNLDLPEQNVGNQLGYILDLPKRIKLMLLMRKFHGIQSSVRGFSGDVEQLLICARRRVDDLETRTYNIRMSMAEMSLNNTPLKQQLAAMIKTIEGIGESLRN